MRSLVILARRALQTCPTDQLCIEHDGDDSTAIAILLNHLGQFPTPVGPAKLSTLWKEQEAAVRQLRMLGLAKTAVTSTLRYYLLDGTAAHIPLGRLGMRY